MIVVTTFDRDSPQHPSSQFDNDLKHCFLHKQFQL